MRPCGAQAAQDINVPDPVVRGLGRGRGHAWRLRDRAPDQAQGGGLVALAPELRQRAVHGMGAVEFEGAGQVCILD